MSFGFALYSYNPHADLPRSFAECEALYASKRTTWSGRIAHNTTLEVRGNDAFAIRLHATDIVTFYRDGRAVLSSGTWQSSTTRNRLNRAGFRVGTTGGVASLTLRGLDGESRSVTFADGMTVYPGGAVSYPDPDTDPDPERVLRRRRRALRRGEATLCDGRQSSRWQGGNVPEAFERGAA